MQTCQKKPFSQQPHIQRNLLKPPKYTRNTLSVPSATRPQQDGLFKTRTLTETSYTAHFYQPNPSPQGQANNITSSKVKERERVKWQTFQKFLRKVEDQSPRFRSFSKAFLEALGRLGADWKVSTEGPGPLFIGTKPLKFPKQQETQSHQVPKRHTIWQSFQSQRASLAPTTRKRHVPLVSIWKRNFVKIAFLSRLFWPGQTCDIKGGIVGSSLKSATWVPLPWPRRWPPLRHVASLIPPGGNSVRPTFHLLRIFHSRRLPPDGREVRFNFPGQTCPDLLATLTRSTSATDDSDSPDNLTRQTLAICRIHFCPQSRSKLR